MKQLHLPIAIFLLLLTPFLTTCKRETPRPTYPTLTQPPFTHVVIISIDGGRPDVILRASTPNIRALMARGAYTFWARTIPMAITLPSHTSMLTGVPVEVHGITWNKDLPEGTKAYPAVPTIFELAKKAGFTTAMATGKSKFAILARPGTVDWLSLPLPEEGAIEDDLLVGQNAAEIIRNHRPNVTFVHFASADITGHKFGWGTPAQVEAIERIDQGIGEVLQSLQEADLMKSTLVIVTADHGGAGFGHGPNDPRSRHIPWIAAGPGIHEGFDLTRISGLTVNTEDTFATACYMLGIPLPGYVQGQPVLDIMANRDLLTSQPSNP